MSVLDSKLKTRKISLETFIDSVIDIVIGNRSVTKGIQIVGEDNKQDKILNLLIKGY